MLTPLENHDFCGAGRIMKLQSLREKVGTKAISPFLTGLSQIVLTKLGSPHLLLMKLILSG